MTLREWLQTHGTVLSWMGIISIVMFVGTLIVLPLLVVRLPADYFTREPRSRVRHYGGRAVLHGVIGVLKNFLGLMLVVAGVAMLVLPGQGVLTILLGLTLMDVPGKRALEQRIVQQPTVFHAINWMRRRAYQPDLEMPTPVAPPGARRLQD